MALLSEVERLKAEVRSLEAVLERSVFIENYEILLLRDKLGLTPFESAIVLALYQSRVGLDYHVLNRVGPDYVGPREDRARSTTSVLIHRIRKKLGNGFIETVDALYPASYKLSQQARERIGEILTEE